MGLMTDERCDQIKDYIHPKMHTFVEHYRCRHLIDLMLLTKMEPENLYDTT